MGGPRGRAVVTTRGRPYSCRSDGWVPLPEVPEDRAGPEGVLRASDEARLMAALPRRRLLAGLGALALAGASAPPLAAAAVSPVTGGPPVTDEIGDQVQRLPRGRLPAFAADQDTARLYRFAVDRPDVLGYMPCYCGCGRAGHRDNRHCYVKAEHPDGTVTYTSHAAT